MCHVCFDLLVGYGVDICVDVCAVVCVVECCLLTLCIIVVNTVVFNLGSPNNAWKPSK